MKWLALIIMLASSSALADGTAFKYMTDDGVVSFTDDLKRVPAKYQAKEVTLGGLADYDRFTPIETIPEALEVELNHEC